MEQLSNITSIMKAERCGFNSRRLYIFVSCQGMYYKYTEFLILIKH